MVVLIDSGASHNFTSSEVVQQLGYPLSSTTSYGVKMGTSLTVKGEGVCRQVALRLSGLVIEDFFTVGTGWL